MHDEDECACIQCQDERLYTYADADHYDKYSPYPPESLKSAAQRVKRTAMAQAKEAQRKADSIVLRAQQARMSASEERECPECFLIGKCDPDDFLCIACRSGRSAIPPGYSHYWRRPEASAA